MESRRIIVGVDGSEGSHRALRWAIAEAAKQDTVIEAITVWQSPFGFGDTAGARVDESKIEQAARARLEQTIAEVAGDSPTVRIDPAVVEGDPAQVGGSLGHSPFASVALGSVSTRCAQHSPCPVVIVPKDDEGLPGAGDR